MTNWIAGAAIVLLIVACIAAAFGWVFFVGWVAFKVYQSSAPESWPTIGYWPMVGIVFLLSCLFGGSGVTVTRA